MEIEKNEKNEENMEYKEVKIDSIVIPEWLPRKPELASHDDYALKESIDTMGLLNPLTVRDIGAGKYELLAGTRRYAAIKASNADTVRVHIMKDFAKGK